MNRGNFLITKNALTGTIDQKALYKAKGRERQIILPTLLFH